MAESVDALVSNTSGATRAGSTPALGTDWGKSQIFPQFFAITTPWFAITQLFPKNHLCLDRHDEDTYHA